MSEINKEKFERLSQEIISNSFIKHVGFAERNVRLKYLNQVEKIWKNGADYLQGKRLFSVCVEVLVNDIYNLRSDQGKPLGLEKSIYIIEHSENYLLLVSNFVFGRNRSFEDIEFFINSNITKIRRVHSEYLKEIHINLEYYLTLLNLGVFSNQSIIYDIDSSYNDYNTLSMIISISKTK